MPYEIFIKEFPNAVIDDFANAFSEISIYILKGNNYKCIFNEETRWLLSIQILIFKNTCKNQRFR